VITPRVTEAPLRLEPVTPDPFAKPAPCDLSKPSVTVARPPALKRS